MLLLLLIICILFALLVALLIRYIKKYINEQGKAMFNTLYGIIQIEQKELQQRSDHFVDILNVTKMKIDDALQELQKFIQFKNSKNKGRKNKNK